MRKLHNARLVESCMGPKGGFQLSRGTSKTGLVEVIGGKDVEVSSGQIIIMPSNVPHAVTTEKKFKMLLTMIRA